MMIAFIFFSLLTLSIQQDNNSQLLCSPFAARIALGYYYTAQSTNSSNMIELSFNTNYSCPNAFVQYWQTNSTIINNITNITTVLLNMSEIYQNFTPPLNYTYFTYTQRVSFDNLIEGQNYTYQIYGNETEGPLGPYTFNVPFRDKNDQLRMIFMGDMDSVWFSPNASNATFNWLQNQVATNQSAYDALVFLGDMAYNLEAQDCYRGDFWLRNISDIFTPYWPFMVVPGNHDAGNNTQFPMLQNYFWTPQLSFLNVNGSYYNFFSYNLGYAHFINFNPYWQVYNTSTEQQNLTLYYAMLEDLKIANQSRAERPWIIVYCHYPIYCSDPTNPMCSANWYVLQNFTQLFQEYAVDLFIAAHQHDYERDKPFFNNQSVSYISEDEDHIIINSQAPINIVDGAAGNNYYMPDEVYQIQPYTDFQSVAFGVGILTVLNQTHIYWEQICTVNNSIIDYLVLIKPLITTQTTSQKSRLMWLWITLGICLLLLIIIGIYMIKKYQDKKNKEQKQLYQMQDISIRSQ